MPINHLINPINGKGLDLQVNSLKMFSPLPQAIPANYNVSIDDLLSQKMLVTSIQNTPVNVYLPSASSLSNILKKNGDYLQITLKYRSSNNVTVRTIDNSYNFIFTGSSYVLKTSNDSEYVSVVIGVGKHNNNYYMY